MDIFAGNASLVQHSALLLSTSLAPASITSLSIILIPLRRGSGVQLNQVACSVFGQPAHSLAHALNCFIIFIKLHTDCPIDNGR